MAASSVQTWRTKRFLELVRLKISEAAASAVVGPVRAVPWKLWMAQFHAYQAKQVIRRLLPDEGDERIWATGQLLSEAAPGEQKRPLRLAQFEAEAHTIACAQSLHSLVDLFGPIVYIGLGLSALGAAVLNKRQQYPARVYRLLHKSGKYEGVAVAFRSTLALPAYRYLRAYVNTTKHDSLVPACYAISFECSPPDTVHGLRISEFEYEDQKFDRIWAADLTDGYQRAIREVVVALGIELNNALEVA